MVLGLPYRHGQNLMHIPAHHRYPLILCVISATLSACSGGGVPSDSGCRNLVYKESGLSRAEYLPCASEIVIALEEVARLSDLASRGDTQARADGRAALSRVNALMREAGGRNLLERWQDRALTDLNLRISNSVSHFDSFYMVRVLEEPDQFAAKTREAADSELRAAIRNQRAALSYYRRLQ
jgi:hypothetical protein